MKSTSGRGIITVQRAEPGGSRGLKELEEKQSDSCESQKEYGKNSLPGEGYDQLRDTF